MAVPEDALRACTATHKRYEEMVWCIGLNVGSIAGMLVHAPSTQADAPGHALVPFIQSSTERVVDVCASEHGSRWSGASGALAPLGTAAVMVELGSVPIGPWQRLWSERRLPTVPTCGKAVFRFLRV